MENPSLLPLRFMARRLRVPMKWLRSEALAGRVPHLDAGGQVLFNPVVVEAEMASRAACTEGKEESNGR
jgi:hypothetical protein